MKALRELSGWAQRQQQTCGCVSFCVFLFFFLPTQRGRLKWTDYSSHERQHSSRVAFEPNGDKEKKEVSEWVQSSAEVAEPRCRKSSCFTAATLTQPVAQTLCDTQEPCQRSVPPRATTNTVLFWFFFFTTIKLYHSCVRKKLKLSKNQKSKSVKLHKLIRATTALQCITKGLKTSGIGGFFVVVL